MNKKSLQAIREVYEKGGNIIQHLKQNSHDLNTLEMILISYDFQSGNYVHQVEKDPEYNQLYTSAIARVITRLGVRYRSILEVGVGEATTLANVVQKLPQTPQQIFGFDISWSRIKYAIEYLQMKHLEHAVVFTGDFFNAPLADSSIDIVYTSHSIEPSGGREKEALLELMRITNKYLILLEPAYELANKSAQKRMEDHGYVKNLYKTAIELNLKVVEHRLFGVTGNPLNPTGLMVIKKNSQKHKQVLNPLVCPITKTPLRLLKGSYFSDESLLAYPIIDQVPCLISDNAVIATHYGKQVKLSNLSNTADTKQ